MADHRLMRLVLLAIAWAMGGMAWAGKGVEIAVVGLHVQGQDDDKALESAERIAGAMASTGRLDPVEPGAIRARMSGREPLVLESAFLSRGRRLLDEGRVLYERADFEAAIPVIEDAVQQLEDGLVGTTAPKDLIDALLLLGLANASMGNTDGASAAYARVVVLDPTRELDTVNYSPKIVTLYNEVRDGILALPKARLAILAPEDATIYVDGIESLSNTVALPPGVHYVLVIGTHGRRSFGRLELAPDKRMTWQARLEGRELARSALEEADRSLQIELLYRALGDHVNTGLILLGGEVSDHTVVLQLYEPRTGNFSKIVTSGSDTDAVGAMVDLVPTIANYVTDQGTLRSDRVSHTIVPLYISDNTLLASMLLDPVPIVETVTVTRKVPWYLWAGVAAVAAGGAGGVVYAVAQGGGGNEPDQGVITVGPFP